MAFCLAPTIGAISGVEVVGTESAYFVRRCSGKKKELIIIFFICIIF